MNISNFISATSSGFLQISPEECVTFINALDGTKLSSSFETHGENHFFVFSLGYIYLKAKATRSFPMRLAELIFHHVNHRSQGYQEFLKSLNTYFEEHNNETPRNLLGLYEKCSSKDIKSFLKPRNSSPLSVFYWLQMAIKKQKTIVKEFFQILNRIRKNPLIFDDVKQLMVANKSQLLFHKTIGCIVVMINTDTYGGIDLLDLFEIDWNLTFAELELLRNFLRKRPISANILFDPQYMSADCSRYLIGNVMNLAGILDASGRLTQSDLLLPANLVRIAEFVYLSDNDLSTIFRTNHNVFNQILIPGKYSFQKTLIFFNNLMYSNQELFSRICDALKEYGNKLTPQDLKLIPNVLKSMPDDILDVAHFFLAFMCIEREEKIGCLNDYIMLLNALLNRGTQKFIQITPSSPSNFPQIVRNLRKCLPNFVLNLMCLEIRTPLVIQLLPVLQTNKRHSDYFFAFLELNAQNGSFACLLQLLMFSETLEQIWANMVRVMEYIGQQAIQLSPDHIDFIMMQDELFYILDELFNNRFKVELSHFNDHIYGLLPKHPENSILDAFVADKRFYHLVRCIYDEREVTEFKKKCEIHLRTMPSGSTLDDAQKALDIILFECPICTMIYTKAFTTILLQCGHTLCTVCAEKICSLKKKNCPTCREVIISTTELQSINIRFQQNQVDPAEKRQRYE